MEETNWLYHVRQILCGAIRAAQVMYVERQTVLCHCSDGWDRTAQICSLVQVPLHRTSRQRFCRLVFAPVWSPFSYFVRCDALICCVLPYAWHAAVPWVRWRR